MGLRRRLRWQWRVAPSINAGSMEDVRSLRNEMTDSINKLQIQLTQLVKIAMAQMQAEADCRAEAMLKHLVQTFSSPKRLNSSEEPRPRKAGILPGHEEQVSSKQGQQQSAKATQSTWASVAGTGAQAATGWTTVAKGRRKPKNHPQDQRRVLFVRNIQSHEYDPRGLMFEANKAFAHAKTNMAVRLIKMRYTEKGNLSAVV